MPDSPADYETITYERRGRVGLITLNRPEKLNAWNPRMETEFIDVVNRAAEDRDVGVLVVTGNGRAFCAGGDISRWSDNIASKEDRPRATPMLDRDGSPEVPVALSPFDQERDLDKTLIFQYIIVRRHRFVA